MHAFFPTREYLGTLTEQAPPPPPPLPQLALLVARWFIKPISTCRRPHIPKGSNKYTVLATCPLCASGWHRVLTTNFNLIYRLHHTLTIRVSLTVSQIPTLNLLDRSKSSELRASLPQQSHSSQLASHLAKVWSDLLVYASTGKLPTRGTNFYHGLIILVILHTTNRESETIRVPAKDVSADWTAQSPEYFSVRTQIIELAQRSQADSETDSIPSGAKIGKPRSWTEPRRRQGFNIAKRTTRMLSKHAAGGVIIINIIIMDVRAATWPNMAHLLMEAEVSRQLQASLSHLHSDASPIMTQLRGRCQFCTGHTIHTRQVREVTVKPLGPIHCPPLVLGGLAPIGETIRIPTTTQDANCRAVSRGPAARFDGTTATRFTSRIFPGCLSLLPYGTALLAEGSQTEQCEPEILLSLSDVSIRWMPAAGITSRGSTLAFPKTFYTRRIRSRTHTRYSRPVSCWLVIASRGAESRWRGEPPTASDVSEDADAVKPRTPATFPQTSKMGLDPSNQITFPRLRPKPAQFLNKKDTGRHMLDNRSSHLPDPSAWDDIESGYIAELYECREIGFKDIVAEHSTAGDQAPRHNVSS
ncbi:uncharacterized protein CLUP02_06436 [Colletotrichum lupini]|uniref:Uncharacterized protein n=1 Tax=Colletotrichum lupini TaxID=145971 RepID=A0A9Q8SQ05_9PEZI|nr:uncharacterized protein CLUP02_06436 [Colletotrichum lupini]UQC80950.1 hypothetical protein CLUP02_06436 [Colletotrichum lupini]